MEKITNITDLIEAIEVYTSHMTLESFARAIRTALEPEQVNEVVSFLGNYD